MVSHKIYNLYSLFNYFNILEVGLNKLLEEFFFFAILAQSYLAFFGEWAQHLFLEDL